MDALTETGDADAARDMLVAFYGVRRNSVPQSGTLLRIGHTDLGPVQLSRTTFGMTCHIDSDPLGVIYLGRVRSGAITYHHGRDTVDQVTGDAYLVTQPAPHPPARRPRSVHRIPAGQRHHATAVEHQPSTMP